MSHTDLAHIYYASCCQQIKTFHSLEGLVETLRQYQQEVQYHSSDFAKLYTKEKVKEYYQQVLGLKR